MLRSLFLAIALLTAAAPALAEEHHHGPLHADDVLNNPQFWAAGLNFVLLLLLLRKMGKKPLSEFLHSRRAEMERSMNEAAEMKHKAEARFKEYSDRLAQLDTELGKLKSDIAVAAEADKKQIVAEAEENARRLKRETESLIEQYSKQLSANVRREVVEAALVAAEQRLRAAITDTDQERLADGFKRRLQERP